MEPIPEFRGFPSVETAQGWIADPVSFAAWHGNAAASSNKREASGTTTLPTIDWNRPGDQHVPFGRNPTNGFDSETEPINPPAKDGSPSDSLGERIKAKARQWGAEVKKCCSGLWKWLEVRVHSATDRAD
eukprot:TRINITY_DN37369_c0_g1_i1.p1 TRINITY_DN37369_c0_g1~~TRINITY_DN37369_c0_g1_i1.p1  ORF type:complete len:130 (+),score=2.28 TRINITY_DN37369_c0_g1_i1:909-1298(+)